MNNYFPIEESMYSEKNSNTKAVIKQIISRYRGDNPEVPVSYHIYPKENFHITEDYIEEIKIHEKFPEMENESYAYAWAELEAVQEGPFHLRLGVYGPVFLYVNGELVYRSTLYSERFSEALLDVAIPLKKGCNSLLFLCIKTPLGCGIRIGSSSFKGRRIQFFAPTRERKGMGGFIYSEPVKSPLATLPNLWDLEKTMDINWYPKVNYTYEEEKGLPIERIFKDLSKKYLVYTLLDEKKDGMLTITGQVTGKGILYIKPLNYRGEKLQEQEVSEAFSHKLNMKAGKYQIVLFGKNPIITLENVVCPVVLQGGHWDEDKKLRYLYAGPFASMNKDNLLEYLDVRTPLMTEQGFDFWYVDKKSCRIRPYNEKVNFGEWSYPLGVTLYGMLEGGRIFEDKDIVTYVGNHLKKAAGFYEYCMWDKSEYGAAPFHNQITTLDCLDDCGSFGSVMLEYKKDNNLPEGEKIVKVIAEFMKNEQCRLPDGTFYRDFCYLPIMDKTMWADDMYMSIPFLCRYYLKTGEASYLDDVIHQVMRYYHYLYMPENQVMSHIYDVKYKLQTKVPWGRGNGWVIFSIAELLEVLPMTHPRFDDILAIYRKLCRGYVALQDNEGMWHQVLTMPESYPETSCTAMFIYAFSKGARHGWFEEPTPYKEAAYKGWEALCKISIDNLGNIFGVCRGSGYSFSKEYYANDLTWNINDNHGTGIVILAGVEVERLMRSEENEAKI